jgi:ParB/RepB/Spo0J family partition protein
MSKKSRNELEALISDDEPGEGAETLAMSRDVAKDDDFVVLPIAEIDSDSEQVRKRFPKIPELAESIRRNGVRQPIEVFRKADGRFQIISGERRYRAGKIAGLENIRAFICAVDSKKLVELQVIENLQREDLNVFESAEGYRRLKEEYAYTDAEVAQIVGKSRPSISKAIGLLKIPESVREQCLETLENENSRQEDSNQTKNERVPSRDIWEKVARQKSPEKMVKIFGEWVSGETFEERTANARIQRTRKQKNQAGNKPKTVFPKYKNLMLIAQSMVTDPIDDNDLIGALDEAKKTIVERVERKQKEDALL